MVQPRRRQRAVDPAGAPHQAARRGAAPGAVLSRVGCSRRQRAALGAVCGLRCSAAGFCCPFAQRCALLSSLCSLRPPRRPTAATPRSRAAPARTAPLPTPAAGAPWRGRGWPRRCGTMRPLWPAARLASAVGTAQRRPARARERLPGPRQHRGAGSRSGSTRGAGRRDMGWPAEAYQLRCHLLC